MTNTAKFYFGDTVKMVSDDTSEGYLVRFTSADKHDLHKQWFGKDTEFFLDVSPIVGKMVLYNHGMDQGIGTIPIGEIVHSEVRDDGIFVRKRDIFREQLTTYAKNRSTIQTLKPAQEFIDEFMYEVDEYEKMLQELRANNYFKFSSGALPQSVEWDGETGQILKWQIIEGSETGTPAEPRRLTQIYTSKTFETLELTLPEPPTRGLFMFNRTSQQDGQPKEANTLKEDLQTVGTDLRDDIFIEQSSDTEVKTMTQQPDTIEQKMLDDESRAEIERMIASAMERLKMQEDEASKMDDDETEMSGEKMEDEYKSASIIADAVRLIRQQDQAEQAEAKKFQSAVETEVQKQLSNIRGTYARHEVGGRTSEKTAPKIQVYEDEAYRSLSASDMALAVKLAYAKIPDYAKKRTAIGDIFSESFAKTMAHKMQAEAKTRQPLPYADQFARTDYADMMKSVKNFTKADEINASDITNQGDEWATVFYDTDLWTRVRENTELFNIMASKGMRVKDIPRGAESMDVYLETGSGTVYTGKQANDVNNVGAVETVVDIEAITTDKVNMPLAKHTLAYAITYELEERSIINIVDVVNNDITMTLAEALEDALLNGDKTIAGSGNINLDNATPATTTYGQTPLYTAWDGIRHAYLVDHTARRDDQSGASLSLTMLEDVVQLLDNRFRTRRDNMIYILDTKTESALRKLSDLLTYYNAGDKQTVWTGAIPPLFGVVPYTSGFMPRTGADGRVDSDGSEAGANVLGGIALAYCPFWQYGRQRNITIESDKNILGQTTYMVASITHAFRRRGDNASAGLYNVAVV